MTSGIYQLTFSSGDTYIGKSVNVENRWRQHLNSMTNRTAAKNMQAAYDTYGEFDPKLLLACHPDHLDLAESCLISRFKPSLNTTRPPDPFAGMPEDNLIHVFTKLGYSTLDHINEIIKLEHNAESIVQWMQDERGTNSMLRLDLESQISRLSHDRSEEELDNDLADRIAVAEAESEQLTKELTRLQRTFDNLTKQLKYERLPWWKKMFGLT